MRKLGGASLGMLLWAMLGGVAPSEQAAASAPPVVKKKGLLTGQKYLEQSWLGGDLTVPMGRLSVAEKYYWFGRTNLAMPTELAVRCQLAADGTVEKYMCNLDGEDADPLRGFLVAEADAGLSAAIALGVFDGPTPFPTAKNYGGQLFVRWVRYRLKFEAEESGKIDLNTGPLVSFTQLQGLQAGLGALDERLYPARAMREQKGGFQTIECQVQSDYSIICNAAGFEPAENGPLFQGAAVHFLRKTRAAEKLVNGQNSAGVRFRLRIRWTLPT